jgi:hypothetical protein
MARLESAEALLREGGSNPAILFLIASLALAMTEKARSLAAGTHR